jgi:choline-sulfatase
MRRLIAAASVILVAVIAWVLVARARRPHVEAGGCRGCNVLLITIDTLRLDRVGAFGGTRNLTPALDGLARDGLTLTRAYASAPLTLPSHTSILTAVSPPVHGVRANGLSRLGPKLPTLATVLKAAGYRTGAFVGAFVLDARFGLTRGFDVYDDRYGEKHEGDLTEGAERRAEDVIKPALAYIHQPSAIGHLPSASHQPWFVWVHLYDPHEPYAAPEPWRSQHEPYDAEVAYTDAMIGRLLDDLRSAGQLDRTLVVVAADHGESLGEHGERTHGTFVYESTMRVPWIVWSANGVARGTFGGLVRLIDLAPTTLDLLGIGAPVEFEGRSIATLSEITGSWVRARVERTAYLEAMDANLTRNWAPLTAIVGGNAKLIDLPIPELYDLASDPGETRNVYSREPARARTLESLLRDQRATLDSRAAGAEKTALTAEARQRLQALGYTASTADPRQRIYTDADDPKRLIAVADALNRAIADFDGGARANALAAVRSIVRDHPEFVIARIELASMQRRTGDLAGAITTLDDLARRGLADRRAMVVLADYVSEAGDRDRAVAILEAVIAQYPDDADAYNSVGVIEMHRGRHDRAQAAFRRVLELDPTSATAYANIGADDLAARDLPAAIDAWKQAVVLDGRNYDTLYNLAMALDLSGRRDEARVYLLRFANEAPPARYARDIAEARGRLAGTKK